MILRQVPLTAYNTGWKEKVETPETGSKGDCRTGPSDKTFYRAGQRRRK
jgi:hypothetical protein